MNLRNKKTLSYFLFFMILTGVFSPCPAQDELPPVFINEFMASNIQTIASPEFSEYADWLELFNGSDTIVDIGGGYLTDDQEEPGKWQIPIGVTIGPHETILFWADGRNQGMHTNFSLSRSGETIALFSPTGILIDSIQFGEQYPDISMGRFPDGYGSWLYFDKPTPGAPNTEPGFTERCPEPVFVPDGGFYSAAVTVDLRKADSSDVIRYTIDGSVPNSGSEVYQYSLSVDKTMVIRAQAFREDYLPSKVVTRTYFIDEPTQLPIVSVATDPHNLWDDETGIYVEGTNGIPGYCSSDPKNWNQPWEKPISLEMYEADRSFAFRMNAGMQIGGGCTRLYPQKTLAVYARSEYSFREIEYPLFRDKPILRYNNLLLRNSGQDWWRAMFRDGMMHTLVKDQMDIDWQAYKPAIVFLNGAYWGIHGIREKHNEHYLAANYGIDPYAIDILTGNRQVKQGSADHYQAMMEYIENNHLSVDQHYNWVASQMDINEYLNYVIAEIYFANIDWPGGNIKYWRQQGEKHKWRWILFDLDLGFGAHSRGQYYSNTLENATAPEGTYYANPSWSTFLLRSLLDNSDFRNRFIQRFASHLNVTFEPQRVITIIDSLKSDIENEISRHIQKWEQSTSFNDGWYYHIKVMKEFAAKRPEFMIQHLAEKFELGATAELQVTHNGSERGRLSINGVKLQGNPFRGTYFKDIPLRVKAVPNIGYRFAEWQGLSNARDDSIRVILTKDSTLHAIFELDSTTAYEGIRINEILALNERTIADEFGEYDDWIELYNSSPVAVDVGGMYMTDDLAEPYKWQIPANDPEKTTIAPHRFLLLWADNDPEQGPLHLNFRLSGDGEEVGLTKNTDSGFVFIDTLVFGKQSNDVSYGRIPDGSANFQFFTEPTPGESNKITGLQPNREVHPEKIRLYQNYPNPFNSSTRIRFTLERNEKVNLMIIDITGQVVAVLVDKWLTNGAHTFYWKPARKASGQYFLKLTAGNKVRLKRILYIK